MIYKRKTREELAVAALDIHFFLWYEYYYCIFDSRSKSQQLVAHLIQYRQYSLLTSVVKHVHSLDELQLVRILTAGLEALTTVDGEEKASKEEEKTGKKAAEKLVWTSLTAPRTHVFLLQALKTIPWALFLHLIKMLSSCLEAPIGPSHTQKGKSKASGGVSAGSITPMQAMDTLSLLLDAHGELTLQSGQSHGRKEEEEEEIAQQLGVLHERIQNQVGA